MKISEEIPASVHRKTIAAGTKSSTSRNAFIVALFAILIYFCGIITPPSLMDDVDAVQATIARNMIQSGDWVTARLDGVKYLEKSPLVYWLMAGSYKIFGLHDWAARLPIAIGAIALALLTFYFARWAFRDEDAGLYAGLSIATCIGLYLFTRVLIPDVLLTLAIAVTLFAFARLLEPEQKQHRRWAAIGAAAMGAGLLLKGLIAVVFPIGTIFIYMLLMGKLTSREMWRRMHPWMSIAIILAVAAPWHIIATLHNPPYFDFTMVSRRGEYHGFFWFYFFNEHLFRFLNKRYPHDYNTVPRWLFWSFNVLWLFPFIFYLPSVFKQSFRADGRAGRVRLLALCWIMVVMVFFTFSTTQEYYSMPIYPAVALLIGSAMAERSWWSKVASRILAVIFAACAAACTYLLWTVRHIPAIGDISHALDIHAAGGVYTYSLGHALDLTINSFAYLRAPLAMAAIAFTLGTVCALALRKKSAAIGIAAAMFLFFQAARKAMVVFDPYLSSHQIARTIEQLPKGDLISDGAYYELSSIWFYTNQDPLIWNGRVNNLVYGSFAPGAPDVFIDDAQFSQRWNNGSRHYLLSDDRDLARIEHVTGTGDYFVISQSGGKTLISNLRP